MHAHALRPWSPPLIQYIHSPAYRVDIGSHVFPTRKYDALKERLMIERGVGADRFRAPSPAEAADILRVHTRRYFEACRDDRLSVAAQMRMELPWSESLFDAACRCVQGSIDAGMLALEHGVGLHIGGGFHHAFAGHGEGFCVFNDPACAVRALQHRELIARALVVDVDVHQGNGTAAIFATDDSVVTFSIHQEMLYPLHKSPSDVDVGLVAGIEDDAYLEQLRDALVPLLDRCAPDLLVYVAGADPYRGDQLGGLGLSIDGLRRRDRLVVEHCAERRLPMLLVLAGGYARDVEDTVDIHLGTLLEAGRLWRDEGVRSAAETNPEST